MVGQLIPRTRTVVTCRQWPAGPSGSLCHVAATKTKQKEGKECERERTRTRGRKGRTTRSDGATAQHRGEKGGGG